MSSEGPRRGGEKSSIKPGSYRYGGGQFRPRSLIQASAESESESHPTFPPAWDDRKAEAEAAQLQNSRSLAQSTACREASARPGERNYHWRRSAQRAKEQQ